MASIFVSEAAYVRYRLVLIKCRTRNDTEER